jgi:hypothetical protein
MEFGRRYFWRELSTAVGSARNKVTTEGDELKMAASGVANQFVGHGRKEKSKSQHFKTDRVGRLERLSIASALRSWSGIFQPCALGDRKGAKSRATRVYAVSIEEQSHFPW